MTFFGILAYDLDDFLLIKLENKNITKKSRKKNLFMLINVFKDKFLMRKK